MKQTRAMSLLEAVANVVIGYGVAVLTQMLVSPLFGMQTMLRYCSAMPLAEQIAPSMGPSWTCSIPSAQLRHDLSRHVLLLRHSVSSNQPESLLQGGPFSGGRPHFWRTRLHQFCWRRAVAFARNLSAPQPALESRHDTVCRLVPLRDDAVFVRLAGPS